MSRTDANLRLEFVRYMSAREGFPAPKNFEKALRDDPISDGIKNGVYADMILGRVVSLKHIVSLVRYLRACAERMPEKSCADVFVEYLKINGIDAAGDRSDSAIASNLIEEVDYVGVGHSGLVAAFTAKRLVERSVRGCDVAQVREAVRWMYAYVGRDIAPLLSTSEAQMMAAEHIGNPLDRYCERALLWWTFDRWTVIQARGRRRPTGMSIILPLRPESYELVRAGRLATFDIEPHHLERPSRYLLVEACCEQLPEIGGESGNTTRHTAKALAVQAGILSRCHGKAAKTPLRFLSFAGTPKSASRLKNHGYKPVGTTMPVNNVDIYESVLQWPPRSSDDLLFLGLLAALGDMGDDLLRPPGDE